MVEYALNRCYYIAAAHALVNLASRGIEMEGKQSKKLLTLFEAEARTGRKVSTWRRDILQRRIPYVKIGRCVRIPAEVVDRLIAEGWREPLP